MILKKIMVTIRRRKEKKETRKERGGRNGGKGGVISKATITGESKTNKSVLKSTHINDREKSL